MTGTSSPAAATIGRSFLDSVRNRDVFLDILEQLRAKYDFVVAGYVVMPEHFHLLIGQPRVPELSRAMQVLKQRVSLRSRGKRNTANQIKLWNDALPPALWQPRYYDFNVFTQQKYIDKLRYIHRNPVKRGLVESPELWRWSSYRDYRLGEKGRVKIGTWQFESAFMEDPPFAPSAKTKIALSAKDGAPDRIVRLGKSKGKGGPPVDSPGRSSRYWGLRLGVHAPHTPYRLFRSPAGLH